MKVGVLERLCQAWGQHGSGEAGLRCPSQDAGPSGTVQGQISSEQIACQLAWKIWPV